MASIKAMQQRAHSYALDGVSGVILNLSTRGRDAIYVDLISVKEQGNGVGSEVMRNLSRFADINNLWLELTPSSVFGTDPERLVAWYSSFGFLVKGNRMIRAPRAF